MRCELFFITGIIGIAVISGIIGALSSKPGGAEKEEEEEEKAGQIVNLGHRPGIF